MSSTYRKTFSSVSVKRPPFGLRPPEVPVGVGVARGRGLGEAPPPEGSLEL